MHPQLILAVLLQRGERAYQAFLAALLQKEYNTVFHTIQETSVDFSDVEDDDSKYFYNESGEEDEDVIESDEELNADALRSSKPLSVEDHLLQDDSTNNGRGDDTLLQMSSDLYGPEDERFPGVGKRLGGDGSASDTQEERKEDIAHDADVPKQSKPTRTRHANDTRAPLNSVREESNLLQSESVFLE